MALVLSPLDCEARGNVQRGGAREGVSYGFIGRGEGGPGGSGGGDPAGGGASDAGLFPGEKSGCENGSEFDHREVFGAACRGRHNSFHSVQFGGFIRFSRFGGMGRLLGRVHAERDCVADSGFSVNCTNAERFRLISGCIFMQIGKSAELPPKFNGFLWEPVHFVSFDLDGNFVRFERELKA